jgi:predicted dithiol-disulfide oxidoreductase (DUF899 family)
MIHPAFQDPVPGTTRPPAPTSVHDKGFDGVDALWGMYPWLDRAPKGRNETGVWWRRHDEYDRG